MYIYKLYRISNKLYKMKIPIIPKFIKLILRIFFSCVLPFQAEIGEGTILGYQGLGIVIHPKVKIGEKCTVSQGVTIGGTTKKKEVPIIGDNVYIGTGAKIIGSIVIGDNVVIGANAVVTKNIPSNCLVAGVPAVIKKRNINICNYK